jgi:hypothetical protein
VALIVASAQATYAFAPAVFGLIRGLDPALVPGLGASAGATPLVFAVALLIQALAVTAFLAGRHRA